MPALQQRGQDFCLVFSKDEVTTWGLSLKSGVEAVPTKKGLLILLDAASGHAPLTLIDTVSMRLPLPDTAPAVSAALSPSALLNPIDEKIFARLADSSVMAKRMVGTFEKSLSPEEATRFAELLKEGLVEPFKSNEKYKHAIYRVKPLAPAQRPAQATTHKSIAGDLRPEDLTISKNGFMIAANEQTAKEVSAQFYDRIKAGELRGIKGFDGSVYFIETKLYVEYSSKILDFFRSHATATTEEVGSALKVSPWLVRVTCEFLKDDSLLIEKKKGLYKVID
jgi:hypothetical protein